MSTFSDFPVGIEIMAEDGFDVSFDNNGASGSIRFLVPGNLSSEFIRVVRGLPQLFTAFGHNYTRLVPLINPYVDNGLLPCIADQLKVYPAPGSSYIAPLGPVPAAPSILHDWYYGDIHFATPKFALDGDFPLITLNLDGGLDMLKFPCSALHYESDDSKVFQDAAMPIPTLDFSLTHHQVPSLDVPLWIELIGGCNTTEFMDCAEGTVLYLGPSCSGQKSFGGQVSFDVTQKFKFRFIPWNMKPREDTGEFDKVLDSAGNPPNREVDLNQLWAP